MYKITLEEFENVVAHDFQLLSIEPDYSDRNIRFLFLDPQSQECILDISEFISFQVAHKEPWGTGNFIFDFRLLQGQTGLFKLFLTLNSGDEIIIDFEDMKSMQGD